MKQADRLWNEVPLLKLGFPFLLGIALGLVYPDISYAAYGAVTVVMVSIIAIRFVALRLLFLLSVFVLSGYLISTAATERLDESHVVHSIDISSESRDTLTLEVLEKPQQRDRSVKLLCQVRSRFVDEQWSRSSGRILLYLANSRKSASVKQGDVLTIVTQVEPTRDWMIEDFDYGALLERRQIHVRAIADSAHFETIGHRATWRSAFIEWSETAGRPL